MQNDMLKSTLLTRSFKPIKTKNEQGATDIEPFARLLLDHHPLAEGQLKDPQGFAKRLQGLMSKAYGCTLVLFNQLTCEQ